MWLWILVSFYAGFTFGIIIAAFLKVASEDNPPS